MRFRTAALTAIVSVLTSPLPSFAQTASPSQQTSMSVPRLVTISGTYRPAAGQQAARGERVEVVTLAIYAEETGGEPLWQETQNVIVDASGNYSLLLGATEADGVPLDVFATGQARWLGMVWSWPGEADAARVRLTSVPYALSASDATMLGGKPASAYLLAPSAGGQVTTTASTAEEGIVASAVLPGITNSLAKYVNGEDVASSAVFETGGFVGINTTTPLDVIHSRFNNSNGGITGLAVQNTSNTALSYSGMLFYDHTGAVAQFQGFNNSTHEYRINNVASGGSINFMLGGVSRVQINDQGNVGLGFSNATERLMVAGSVRATGELKVNGNQAFGIQWLDAGGGLQAHMHRFGAVDNRLYVTNAGINNLTGVYLAVGATSWTSSSDERLKTNIAPITGILDKIKDIRVVSFDMASLAVDEKTGKAAPNRETPKRVMKNGRLIKQQIGSIAQDWLANFPELVVEPLSDDQYYGLDYDRIGVVALGAVQELNAVVTKKDAEIKELSAVLTKQDAEVKALNDRLAALEQVLQQLKAELERRQPKQE